MIFAPILPIFDHIAAYELRNTAQISSTQNFWVDETLPIFRNF